MDWSAEVDAYCERLTSAFWAEPINALTNLAFLVAAMMLWRRSSGVPLARLLCGILFAIGIGSGLFHTFATRWAGLADVLPIAAYVLVYVYAANRLLLGWRWPFALLGALGGIPWVALLAPAFASLPGLAVSAIYWPVPALILLYAVCLLRTRPDLARDFFIGAAILILSLTFRSIDGTICATVPVGSHFLWHILNAVMLGWMIHVLLRHRLPH